jgi:pimeloyl-ACP methyl ester carboxylesterase
VLELIDKGSAGADHPAPVLFVHGGFHAAWCWDKHFLEYFAERGFRAAAVSLRAHGGSTTTQPLRSCTVADYVEDVASAIARVGGAAVLVGHSMGGFVIQRYLQTHDAPAAVLLASVPPSGTLRISLRLFRRRPLLHLKTLTVGDARDIVGTPVLARETLFSPYTPEPVVRECLGRLESESIRATAYDMIRGPLPQPDHVKTPMLVLGAESDGFVGADLVHATALAYGTTAEIVSGMGHNMMVEPGWGAVADRIIGWLGERGL